MKQINNLDNELMQLASDNLTVSYHRHPAIHHLSCEFKMGATTAIVGPNGAGKSTFLKALLKEIKIDTGQVIWRGITRKDIAYLPQITEIDNLLPLTVQDVVLLGSWHQIGLFGKITPQINGILNDSLHLVGLDGFKFRYINELSRGQMQRILLARIIIQQATIIILDEPFNAMDNKTTDDLLELIQNWRKCGKTIIAVLHDLHQVAAYFEYTMLIAKELIAYDKTKIVLQSDSLREAYANNFIWRDFDLCSNS
jgi:zinc/manganese transport system ATP-binding protein